MSRLEDAPTREEMSLDGDLDQESGIRAGVKRIGRESGQPETELAIVTETEQRMIEETGIMNESVSIAQVGRNGRGV